MTRTAFRTRIFDRQAISATGDRLPVAIIREHLSIETDLYRMLQVFSVMPFERIPPGQALKFNEY